MKRIAKRIFLKNNLTHNRFSSPLLLLSNNFISNNIIQINNLNKQYFHINNTSLQFNNNDIFGNALEEQRKINFTPQNPDTSLLPEWFIKDLYLNDVATRKLGDYDVKFYDKPFIKSFPDFETNTRETIKADKVMFHLRPDQLSDIDLYKLCYLPKGKTKEYICVGEAYYFPLYRDLPVHYTPSSPSLLYIEKNTDPNQQPKIYYQLAPFVPPMFWIPLKGSVDALIRLFEEVMDIESNNVSRHLPPSEEMLSRIGFDTNKIKELSEEQKEKEFETLNVRLMDYINKTVDPNKKEFKDRVIKEHPNHCSLFIGNVNSLSDLEQSFMNNPFVFNTPVLLGSSNRFTSSQSVQTSMFHTVFSRSLIILECRYDLHVDFAASSSDRLIPVFARIYYPNNQRLSKPCIDRMNKVFNTCFPSNIPVDVCLALFGQKNINSEEIAKEMMKMVNEDEELIKSGALDSEDGQGLFNPAIPIAHLAVLGYDKWPTEIFEKFRNHKLPIVRIACVKGCLEFLMKTELEEMKKIETNQEVINYINEALSSIEKKFKEMEEEAKREAKEEAQ
ncbi:hypothetical protein ABK040_000621 [Willaertia magna]